jgi:hypothetical protein
MNIMTLRQDHSEALIAIWRWTKDRRSGGKQDQLYKDHATGP